jgi:hypothetical protein
MEDDLIPKYSVGKRKKTNLEYSKMIREYGSAADKTIRTTVEKNLEYGRVYYVRYSDEIKLFLSERLLLSLNLDKSKITHSTKEKA